MDIVLFSNVDEMTLIGFPLHLVSFSWCGVVSPGESVCRTFIIEVNGGWVGGK